MNLFEAIVIAIVEGITEFLPISSTGHMIIASHLMGIVNDDFTKLFQVAIQLGAILAVVVLYWRSFFRLAGSRFYSKLLVGVLPALAFGSLFAGQIDELLESPLTVAVALLVGGVLLLFIDRSFQSPTIDREQDITYRMALAIGVWQCLAMVPGVSRSAASIIGGMQQKLTRKLAAEFSFFLAVPTMAAATAHKLYQGSSALTWEQLKLLAVGNIVAFVVAILAIKSFIQLLQQHGFRLFGWYRIVAGIVLLFLYWMFKGV